MTTLSCVNLDLAIADVTVVEKLNLELANGQFWGLLGSNGVGKTTLLKCLAGLNPPGSGQVLLEGREIGQLPRKLLARHLGMMQQHTAYVFESTVLQTVLTGRHPHLGHWQREGPEDLQRAHAALAAVGLEGFAERGVTGLSGGEARRLAFASLLVQDTGVMLLDEPSNHLDLRHQVQIMGMIRQLTGSKGVAALAALHDVNLAARYCSHVLMLFGDGQWQAGPCSELLNEQHLQALYGCGVETLVGRDGPRFFPAA